MDLWQYDRGYIKTSGKNMEVVLLIYALQKGAICEYFSFSMKWWKQLIDTQWDYRRAEWTSLLRCCELFSLFTSVMESRSVFLNCIFYGALEKITWMSQVSWNNWYAYHIAPSLNLLTLEIFIFIHMFLSFPARITKQTRKQKYLKISQGGR